MGPLPPPLTGTPISFEILCNELAGRPEIDRLHIVDSSPRHLKQQTDGSSLTKIADVRQAIRVLGGFASKVARADHVVIFGSNGSIGTIVPVLLAICKALGKPCSFRVFGGSLDWYLTELSGRRRQLADWSIQNLDRIIVQTELLRRHLEEELGLPPGRIGVLPGYRFAPAVTAEGPRTPTGPDLKLAFFGIVKADKGVRTLLDAMALAQEAGLSQVSCDIHGALADNFEQEFNDRLLSLDNVRYMGQVGWQQVIDRLRAYDALVLPTSYIGEGHPGVIIEAMLAGVTVISTDFRSIPELVDHNVNGLLVPPGDPEALFKSFERLVDDFALRASLCRENWKRGDSHLSPAAADTLLALIGATGDDR